MGSPPCVVLVAVLLLPAAAYRVVQTEYDHAGEALPAYFEPYNPGFVGMFGDPRNPRRWRVNEGGPFTNAHPNIYEDVHARRTYAWAGWTGARAGAGWRGGSPRVCVRPRGARAGGAQRCALE